MKIIPLPPGAEAAQIDRILEAFGSVYYRLYPAEFGHEGKKQKSFFSKLLLQILYKKD